MKSIKFITTLMSLLVFITICQSAAANTAECIADADLAILENTPSTNWDETYVYVSNFNAGYERRGLLRFDLSNIPAGVIIDSAVLKVWASDKDHIINVHQGLVAWDEATTTWSSYNNGGAAGTDYSTDYVTTDVTRVPGEYMELAIDYNWVQEWVDGVSENYGLLLIQSGGTEQLDITSKEQYGGGYGAYLEVSYTVPVPTNCDEAIAFGYGLEGDVNGDCYVNMTDLSELVLDWLYCVDPADPTCDQPWIN